jgi:branched-subunit amino acid transport protein
VSEALRTWVAIVGIGLTGVVTRMSCLALGERLQLPPLAERALRYAPAAALGAIVVPALIVSGDALDFGLGNHRLPAAIVAGLVMWRTRGMLWALTAGIAVFTLLRLHV